jgi:hypothetical protein
VQSGSGGPPFITATASGPWLQIKLPSAQVITKYSFISGPNSGVLTYALLGSYDGYTWFRLHNGTPGSHPLTYNYDTITIANTVAYQYYRFIFITVAVYQYGDSNFMGFLVGDNSGYYPPTLSSDTDQGYILSMSVGWNRNGYGDVNYWYPMTANRPGGSVDWNSTFYRATQWNQNLTWGGSAVSTFNLPPSAPPAPTSLSASAGNGSASISFTQGSDGGSAISNYKYSLNGGSTFTAFNPVDTASPVVISGLTNGVAYTIQLKGVNSLGDGDASASITVTPATIPDAPTNLVATYDGSGAVSISFTPGSNGGSTILNYQYFD